MLEREIKDNEWLCSENEQKHYRHKTFSINEAFIYINEGFVFINGSFVYKNRAFV